MTIPFEDAQKAYDACDVAIERGDAFGGPGVNLVRVILDAVPTISRYDALQLAREYREDNAL